MITWPQLLGVAGALLPFAFVLLAIGAYREKLRAMEAAFGALKTDLATAKVDLARVQAASAKDQGRRIGNLESFTGLTADGVPVQRMGGGMSGRVRGNEGDE